MEIVSGHECAYIVNERLVRWDLNIYLRKNAEKSYGEALKSHPSRYWKIWPIKQYRFSSNGNQLIGGTRGFLPIAIY